MPDKTELRRWAIEEAIKLHGANGSSSDAVMRDAELLLNWALSKSDPNPVSGIAVTLVP